MKVVWSSRAERDLHGILEYIAARNAQAALEVLDQIEQRTIALLSANPRYGRRGRIEGTLELILPPLPYIVVYSLSDTINILTVRAGWRSWPESLSDALDE